MKLAYLLTASLIFAPTFVTAEEKNPEDPTKIITRVGLGYSNSSLRLSGSLGLDEARMINATITDDASEWSLGGSWLFDAGIVNFDFRKSDFGDGSESTTYSVGTYVPTEEFGFAPWGWMPFITGGYSYNDGHTITDGVKETFSGHSGYLGMFAIKPINDVFTGIAFAGTTQGQNSLSSYWGGGGISYRVNENNSFNAMGVAVDNSIYGSDSRIVFNYRYEFN
ncbi:hypothetical protein JCM19233_1247 [Vibrio astriarenae]|nr:hypothetical protein JCM19233_1247 [Vibrio sp. C7]